MTTAPKRFKDSVLEYCTRIGTDPLLVQGAGGNISWKEGSTLWIKASGKWLADAGSDDIFVPIDINDLAKALNAGIFSVVPKCKVETLLRPSIETLLHALMPQRVVLHLHAIEPLAHLVRYDAEVEVGNKLTGEYRWAYVNYQKPGEALAKSVADAISKSPDTNILLLENHGVVIGGSDVKEVDDLLTQLTSDLCANPVLDSVMTEIPKLFATSCGQIYVPFNLLEVHNLAVHPDLNNRISFDWALYPDHVVFMGSQPMCYDSIGMLNEAMACGISPETLFLKGLGVYAKTSISLATQAQLKCYYDVLIRQPKDARLKSLNDREVAELLNWDAEKYRQHLAFVASNQLKS